MSHPGHHILLPQTPTLLPKREISPAADINLAGQCLVGLHASAEIQPGVRALGLYITPTEKSAITNPERSLWDILRWDG